MADKKTLQQALSFLLACLKRLLGGLHLLFPLAYFFTRFREFTEEKFASLLLFPQRQLHHRR